MFYVLVGKVTCMASCDPFKLCQHEFTGNMTSVILLDESRNLPKARNRIRTKILPTGSKNPIASLIEIIIIEEVLGRQAPSGTRYSTEDVIVWQLATLLTLSIILHSFYT